MIEATIGNLALLNVGRATPEPLTLPTDFETAQTLFKQLGVDDGKHDLVITEYRTDISGLSKFLSQYDSLDELNYLATLLDNLDEAGREKFAAAVEHGEHTGDVEELINLAQNLDCYDLAPDVTNAEELGRYRAEGRLSLPEDCRFYFDYASYGEDTAVNEGGEFTHAGYIHNNRSEFVRHYNGRDIPAEARLFAHPEPSPPERRDSTMGNRGAKAAPLAKNPHVQELLSIMRANNLSGTEDLVAAIRQVGAMERQLDKAVGELAAMRQELETMRQENHPLRKAMQNAVIIMQGNVLHLRDQLAAVKKNVIDGCKNAVAAFQEKGLSALRNVADFFKIRPGLEALQSSIDKGIRQDEAAVAKIENASAEYHEAGRHLQNMGRAMLGKEAITAAKAPGRLAKAVEAPIKVERACLLAAQRGVTAAIGAVGRLEKTERKEPIMETVQKLNEQIAQAKQDAPAKVRPRPVAHDGR